MWLKFLTTKSSLENAEFISIIISLLASFADHFYFASCVFILIFAPSVAIFILHHLLPYFILHHLCCHFHFAPPIIFMHDHCKIHCYSICCIHSNHHTFVIILSCLVILSTVMNFLIYCFFYLHLWIKAPQNSNKDKNSKTSTKPEKKVKSHKINTAWKHFFYKLMHIKNSHRFILKLILKSTISLFAFVVLSNFCTF